MRKPKFSAGFITVLIFWILGIAFGILMMCGAWEDNNQGEFHNENGIEWGSLLVIGFSGFFVISGIPTLIWVTLKLVERFPRR